MFINKFPKTNFTLPNGQSIETINILKTVTLSAAAKNSTSIRTTVYDNIKKIENLAFDVYGNTSLYWLVLYLNDIDSFSKLPTSQYNFETDFLEKNNGKVYYIKDAKSVQDVRTGDLVITFSGDGTKSEEWIRAGVVKEWDSNFRRIILKTEYKNSENTDSNPINPDLFFYRRNEDGTFVEIPNVDYAGNKFKVGASGEEKNKITKLYDGTINELEMSPFNIIGATSSTTEYDFSTTGGTSGTALFKLSNNDLPSFVTSKTFLGEAISDNYRTKTISSVPSKIAGNYMSYVSSLSVGSVSRGTPIDNSRGTV